MHARSSKSNKAWKRSSQKKSPGSFATANSKLQLKSRVRKSGLQARAETNYKLSWPPYARTTFRCPCNSKISGTRQVERTKGTKRTEGSKRKGPISRTGQRPCEMHSARE